MLARSPEIDAMFTTLPPPWRSMTGAQACVHRKGPVRLTAITRSHSAAVCSSIGLNTATPALLTSASMRPKRAASAATAASTCAPIATSHSSASVRSGSPSAAVAFASSGASMSSRPTFQPSRRKRRATASPMPRAAPVTRVTLAGAGEAEASIGRVVEAALIGRRRRATA